MGTGAAGVGNYLKEQEGNYALISDLALVHMGLGDKQAAFALVDRAMAANPMEKDAIAGPGPVEIQARVAASSETPITLSPPWIN